MTAADALRGWSESELVLLAAVLASGLRLRPTDAVRDAEDALTLEQTLRGVVAGELERRELDVQRFSLRLVERAVSAIAHVGKIGEASA